MMDGWGEGGGAWGAWVFMAIMMVMFFALVAAVLYALLRPRHRAGDVATSPRAAGDDALRLLDERFARGDIEAEDYTRRRDVLRSR